MAQLFRRLTFPTFFSLAISLSSIPAQLTLISTASAQPDKIKGTNYAFMVAGARYTHLQPIEGEETINDILEFKKALLETGFDEANIVVMHDRQAEKDGHGARFLPEHEKILKELDLFLDGMKPEDTVLLVLSGHGVLFKGEKSGYFCPVDAKLAPKTKLIPMDGTGGIFELLDKCKSGRKLLIVNACRDAPTVARRTDLAGDKIQLDNEDKEVVPKGIAAIYSCESGQRSYFDPKRKQSLFFLHLTEAWRGNYQSGEGPLTLESVFESTRVKTKADAAKTFGEKQFPVVRRQYEGEWVVVRDLSSVRVPKAGEEREFEIAAGLKMKFCWIPAGESQLGSPQAERDAVLDQLIEAKFVTDGKAPEWLSSEAEEVRGKFRTHGFWLGKYPVTQGEWEAVMGDNPSYFDGKKYNLAKGLKTDRFPVESVSWIDCQKFLDKVNSRGDTAKMLGKSGTFVLPHADQWEYACRGGKGNKQAYFFGNELNGTQANCNRNYPFGTTSTSPSLERTCAVDFTNGGKYEKHPWGLSHMSGNVWQWCNNLYEQTTNRVLRGGSWYRLARYCRSAYRDMHVPDYRDKDIGFRVAIINLRGEVERAQGDLVQLSTVVDAGLSKNTVLELWRNEGGWRYLGTVRVIDVYPKQAIAVFTPARAIPFSQLRPEELPKKGDQVAGR
ncbi:MAG TPA: SUMF1/EgtB/PvdO family nonheme iron enzyme [Gemmata sp.]|jgi:formylglycine-generating enzyme required for sulfatase activity|nr:SUMF1/EgtB/PvdO family nonheme iron enzyme [Gemmata sp.]